MTALRELRRAAARLVAPGTDPDRFLTLLLWSLPTGRHLDRLRRQVRDAVADPALPTLPLEGGPTDGQLGRGGSGGVTPGDAQAGHDDGPAARLVAAAGAVPVTHAADVAQALATWQGLGVRVALVGDPCYPDRLAEGWPDTDGPAWLAWRGADPDDRSAVALVGSRRATGYGTGVTAWLADAAAAAGLRIVSGGAIGVDAAAHGAALGRPGGTTVVLGCGHAVAYPRPHAQPGALFDRILDAGGTIVSECLPGDPPRAHRIRARNRIVAALADVTVIVEGRVRSGSLLTASAALTRDRVVLAVPGDVRAPGSEAPHRLLAEGAAPCTGPADLLAAVRAATGAGLSDAAASGSDGAGGAVGVAASALPAAARRELEQAWPRPVRLPDLAQRSGVPVGALLAAVTRARVSGELVEGHDGLRLRDAPGG